MAIDFPNTPTVGQSFTTAGVTWTWDGAKWIAALAVGGAFVPIAGGTMTGPLILSGDPTVPLGAVDKRYVDNIGLPIGDSRVINGDMRVDQRWNGAIGTAQNGYTIDRWAVALSYTGKGSWGRNLNAIAGPPGFPYYLGFQSSSAYASLAGDTFCFWQGIEADWISDFAWGTASAQPATLQFWAYSSLTGNFGGTVGNIAGTRAYPFSFNIPVANTWTKIVLTMPGDTGGTWVLSGNAGSVVIRFDLGSGSNFRGPAGAWASGPYLGASGTVSVVGTNGATLYVTGVKLETGSVASPFNRLSLAKSLADCMRYFTSFGSFTVSGYGNAGSLGLVPCFIPFPVQMRAQPTLGYTTVPTNCTPSLTAPNNIGMYPTLNSTAAGIVVSQFNSITAASEF